MVCDTEYKKGQRFQNLGIGFSVFSLCLWCVLIVGSHLFLKGAIVQIFYIKFIPLPYLNWASSFYILYFTWNTNLHFDSSLPSLAINCLFMLYNFTLGFFTSFPWPSIVFSCHTISHFDSWLPVQSTEHLDPLRFHSLPNP